MGIACSASLVTLVGGGLSTSALGAVVTRNVGVTVSATALGSYNLDLDQNGSTDFTFQAAYAPDPVLTVGFDQVEFPFGSINAAVIDTQTGDGFPAASLLQIGATVSSASLFSGPNDQANLYSFDSFDGTSGDYNGRTGYVGLRFAGAGGTYYGYAQVTANSLNTSATPFDLTIGTVGYNNVAGQPVTITATAVPEPASLAAAAIAGAGAAGAASPADAPLNGVRPCGVRNCRYPTASSAQPGQGCDRSRPTRPAPPAWPNACGNPASSARTLSAARA